MPTFGLNARETLFMLILCALLAALAWHEHGVAASADAHCDARVAVQVGNENTVTQADQHTADAQRIAEQDKQIQQLQSDSDQANARATYFQARLVDKEKVLEHVLKHSKPTDCINQPVPAALIDSLHAIASSPAKPPG